jgi:hypothetical protein
MTTTFNLLLPIISAILASYLTYYFAIKTRRAEAKYKSKEEKYLKLLVLLKGFVGRTANAQTKREFFDEYYQSWLYSSDEVIMAIKQMLDTIRKNPSAKSISNGKELVGSVVKAMRKDLHGKTQLTADTFEYIDVIE